MSVVFIPPADYWEGRNRDGETKAKYDAWLASRGLAVLQPERREHEPPICKSRRGNMLCTSVSELQRLSRVSDPQLYRGINSVAVGSAGPFESAWNALLIGGEDVYVQAYGQTVHNRSYPPYGVLVDRHFRAEAIFLCSLPRESRGDVREYDTSKYIANLIEWLSQRKASLMEGAWTPSSADAVASPSTRITSAIVERAINDAETLLRTSGATSGVDRIHTAIHGYLKLACDEAGITYEPDASLTKLFKALRLKHPSLVSPDAHSEDIGRVLVGLSSVLDSLNTLRNRGSTAHPNPVLLHRNEALLFVNAARTILQYLDAKLST